MSRTFRTKSNKYFRAPKTTGTRKSEEKAVQELSEGGFIIPPRLSKRGNANGQEIPDNYDDIKVSAFREIPEKKRQAKRKIVYVARTGKRNYWKEV